MRVLYSTPALRFLRSAALCNAKLCDRMSVCSVVLLYAVHTGEIELMAKIEEMRSLLASEKKAEAKAAREREAAYARQQREAAKQQEKIHAEEKKVSCVRLISSSHASHTQCVHTAMLFTL